MYILRYFYNRFFKNTYNFLPPPNNCRIKVFVEVPTPLVRSINNDENSPYITTEYGIPTDPKDAKIMPTSIRQRSPKVE